MNKRGGGDCTSGDQNGSVVSFFLPTDIIVMVSLYNIINVAFFLLYLLCCFFCYCFIYNIFMKNSHHQSSTQSSLVFFLSSFSAVVKRSH